MTNKLQVAQLPIEKTAMPRGYIAYEVIVSGGLGGDTDRELAQGRANTVKILANLLMVAIRQVYIKLYVINFEGGTSDTSIPARATAKVAIPRDKQEAFEVLVTQCDEALVATYQYSDPAVQVDCRQIIWGSSILSEETTHIILATINGIPVGNVDEALQGDDAKDTPDTTDTPDTPVTLNNIASVHMARETIDITIDTRSDSEEKMEALADQIRRIFVVCGCTVK